MRLMFYFKIYRGKLIYMKDKEIQRLKRIILLSRYYNFTFLEKIRLIFHRSKIAIKPKDSLEYMVVAFTLGNLQTLYFRTGKELKLHSQNLQIIKENNL